MNILLTGGSGNLGTELKKILSNCISPIKQELDVTNRKQVFDFFQKNSIDLVIHTAAITNIRLCEENRKLAWDTNVQGTKNLVDAIKKSGFENGKDISICLDVAANELYQNKKYSIHSKSLISAAKSINEYKKLIKKSKISILIKGHDFK